MRRKRNQSTAAAQKIMKERNYNLELIRMAAFLMVIAIHVTNYFCRAYGEVTTGEYLFALVIDTLQSERSLLFHDHGRAPSGKG